MKAGFVHPFTSHDPFIPYSLNVLLELLFRQAGLKLPTLCLHPCYTKIVECR